MDGKASNILFNAKEVAPVLFIMWRRPYAADVAFKAIKKVKPKLLYIACDGARGESDKDLIKQCQLIVKRQIDWDCQVRTRYLDTNEGCKDGVSGAIGWFFANEEAGIVVEDDVVCDESFFYYASELLEVYRNTKKVGMISANSFGESDPSEEVAYDFTLHPHIWGWATWRRVWEEYDSELKDFHAIRDAFSFASILGWRFSLFWMYTLMKVRQGKIITWDYQFAYMFYKRGYVSARPRHELTLNLGFDENSTHSHNNKSPLKAMMRLEGNIKRRETINVNRERDRLVFLSNYWPLTSNYLKSKLASIVK